MPSAGELLRSERMKRSRSLSEIAAQTRINRRYLEAIEADEVRELPGDFFYKAFLRQYASALDLDPATTREILASAVPVSEPDPVPAMTEVYERAHSADSVRWRPSVFVAVVLLMAVLAGGSLLYSWWQRSQAREEAKTVAVPSDPAPAAPAKVSTDPDNQMGTRARSAPDVAEASAQSTPPPQSSPEFNPPLAVAPGQTAIRLNATEPAWVQLTAGGRTVFTGTIEPGQPRQFAVPGPNARLLTGNAGGLEMHVDGKPVGEIGPRGHIRTVVLQDGSVQIVAPKPKPRPEEPPASAQP